MQEFTPQSGPRLLTLDPRCAPAPPGWALALTPIPEPASEQDGVLMRTRSGPASRLLTAVAAEARCASPEEFEGLASALYQRICAALDEPGAPAPVRFWNYIPGIGEEMGGGLDRYRLFNKGRKAALAAWMGECAFDRRLPAATGVGHEGDELVVHCLAAGSAARPLENPRQRPAYRYSARYGPASPSFARATRAAIGGRAAEALLVGGTASVCGEDTVCEGDLDGQLDETIANLQALLVAAGAGADLGRFSSVRVYYRREGDGDVLRARCADLFAGAGQVEFMRAEFCRQVLVVEFVGRAELAPRDVPHAQAPAGAR